MPSRSLSLSDENGQAAPRCVVMLDTMGSCRDCKAWMAVVRSSPGGSYSYVPQAITLCQFAMSRMLSTWKHTAGFFRIISTFMPSWVCT